MTKKAWQRSREINPPIKCPAQCSTAALRVSEDTRPHAATQASPVDTTTESASPTPLLGIPPVENSVIAGNHPMRGEAAASEQSVSDQNSLAQRFPPGNTVVTQHSQAITTHCASAFSPTDCAPEQPSATNSLSLDGIQPLFNGSGVDKPISAVRTLFRTDCSIMSASTDSSLVDNRSHDDTILDVRDDKTIPAFSTSSHDHTVAAQRSRTRNADMLRQDDADIDSRGPDAIPASVGTETALSVSARQFSARNATIAEENFNAIMAAGKKVFQTLSLMKAQSSQSESTRVVDSAKASWTVGHTQGIQPLHSAPPASYSQQEFYARQKRHSADCDATPRIPCPPSAATFSEPYGPPFGARSPAVVDARYMHDHSRQSGPVYGTSQREHELLPPPDFVDSDNYLHSRHTVQSGFGDRPSHRKAQNTFSRAPGAMPQASSAGIAGNKNNQSSPIDATWQETELTMLVDDDDSDAEVVLTTLPPAQSTSEYKPHRMLKDDIPLLPTDARQNPTKFILWVSAMQEYTAYHLFNRPAREVARFVVVGAGDDGKDVSSDLDIESRQNPMAIYKALARLFLPAAVRDKLRRQITAMRHEEGTDAIRFERTLRILIKHLGRPTYGPSYVDMLRSKLAPSLAEHIEEVCELDRRYRKEPMTRIQLLKLISSWQLKQPADSVNTLAAQSAHASVESLTLVNSGLNSCYTDTVTTAGDV